MLTQVTVMLDRFGRWMALFFNLVGGMAMVALIPSFAWLVFGRYVLNSTPTWVEQVSMILMVLITFPVAAACVRDNSHLSVSFLRDALPARFGASLAIISYVAMVVFGCFMLMGGIELVIFSWNKRIPIIHISDGWRFMPMAACGAGIAYYSLLHILRILVGWNTIVQSPNYHDALLDEDTN